jgi:chemotaxis-related protein WspB
VVEVLPLVRYKGIPHAPAYIAGAFTYRGEPVPLIDLSALCLGQPSRVLMSTRIILVRYQEPGGEVHLLGLLAEQATEMIRRQPEEFAETGVAVDSAPYLGPVTTDVRGLIQRVEIDRLLPAEVRDQLFRQPAACP